MNGLGEASKAFQEFLAHILVFKLGFREAKAPPTMFRHAESGLRTAIHVDYPLTTGKKEVVLSFYARLGEWLTVRVGSTFGHQMPVVYPGARYWPQIRALLRHPPKAITRIWLRKWDCRIAGR